MMKSSSSSSVAGDLVRPEANAENIEEPKEIAILEQPKPRPSRRHKHKSLFDAVCSLPTNFAATPGAKQGEFSVGALSEELQRDMEALGLRTPLIQSVNSSQYLGSDEPPSGQFDSQQFKKRWSLKRVLGDCCKSYKKCTKTVAQSMATIPFYVVLMVFASHATYMGFNNIDKCPWSSNLPYFYAAFGVCSLVALTTRTFLLFQRRYFPRFKIYIDRLLFSGAVITFFILYIIHCIQYYGKRYEPTEGKTFCGQYFYNYVRVANWCIPIVFVGMTILHGPTSFWMTTSVPCIERFD